MTGEPLIDVKGWAARSWELVDARGQVLVDVGGRALLETKGEVSVEGEWEGDGESCLDDRNT